MEGAPAVVMFAYTDFQSSVATCTEPGSSPKWSAVCIHCGVKITDRRGTTSGFVRHLQNKHPNVHFEYMEDKYMNKYVDQPPFSSMELMADAEFSSNAASSLGNQQQMEDTEMEEKNNGSDSMSARLEKTPDIVRFAYKDLQAGNLDGGLPQRWSATCIHCDSTISETRGTTSGFVRHLRHYHAAVHADYLRDKYATQISQNLEQQLMTTEDLLPELEPSGRELIQPKKTPDIVKFAYRDFQPYVQSEDETLAPKWSAVCSYCASRISDTRGTTSAFIKHLQRKHQAVYSEYAEGRPASRSAKRQCVMHPEIKTESEAQKIPHIVAFAFEDFQIIPGGEDSGMVNTKWTAQCKYCPSRITELRGTTSGFLKHVHKQHPLAYSEYIEEKKLMKRMKRRSSGKYEDIMTDPEMRVDRTPDVVKFAYHELQTVRASEEDGTAAKWSAVCRYCNVKITETRGTTSGFVRHLHNKHPDIHYEYMEEKMAVKYIDQRSHATGDIPDQPDAEVDECQSMKADQERVSKLLTDTVTLLCKNGLVYSQEIKIQGLLGITLDSKDVFLVQINEVVGGTAVGEATSTSTSYGGAPGEHGRRRGSNNAGFADSNQMTNAPPSSSSRSFPSPTSAMQRGSTTMSNMSHTRMCRQRQQVCGASRPLSKPDVILTSALDTMTTASTHCILPAQNDPSGECATRSGVSRPQQAEAVRASFIPPSGVIRKMTGRARIQRRGRRRPVLSSAAVETIEADAPVATSCSSMEEEQEEEKAGFTLVGTALEGQSPLTSEQTSTFSLCDVGFNRSSSEGHFSQDVTGNQAIDAEVIGTPQAVASANSVAQPVEFEQITEHRAIELENVDFTASAEINCSIASHCYPTVKYPTNGSGAGHAGTKGNLASHIEVSTPAGSVSRKMTCQHNSDCIAEQLAGTPSNTTTESDSRDGRVTVGNQQDSRFPNHGAVSGMESSTDSTSSSYSRNVRRLPLQSEIQNATLSLLNGRKRSAELSCGEFFRETVISGNNVQETFTADLASKRSTAVGCSSQYNRYHSMFDRGFGCSYVSLNSTGLITEIV